MSNQVKIGDIAEQIRGVTFAKSDAVNTPSSGHLPVLRAGNIQDGRLVLDDLVYVKRNRIRDHQLVLKNDVVIAASSGSIHVVGKAARSLDNFDGSFGAFLKVLRPGPNIDPSYFAHYFQSAAYRTHISSLAAGSSINNIKNEHLNELDILLPPLDEQRRIAAILDQSARLRDLYLESIGKLDTLKTSILLTRLSDNAPKLVEFSAVVKEVRNGISPSSKGEHSGQVFTLNAITRGKFDPAASKTALFDRVPAKNQIAKPGDFLICRGNGNKSLVGRGEIVPNQIQQIAFPDTIIGASPEESSIDPKYLSAAWRLPSVRKQIERAAHTTSGIYKINQGSLGKIQIPLLEMPDQRDIAGRLDAIDHHSLALTESADQATSLYQSLQYRAFRSEL